MRILILSVLCTLMFSNVFAQENDSTKKSSNHYFGLQVNSLYREILSFNDNNAPINNPYLFTYSSSNKVTSVGVSMGLGLTINQFTDGDDNFERKTNRSDFNFRIGPEKKSFIGKNILIGAGVDLLLGSNVNSTTTKNLRAGGGGSNEVTTEVKTKTFGLGPRVNINYMISNRFLIGTEATYYFKYSKINQKDDINNVDNETTATIKSFELQLPLVLYLKVKF